MTAKRTTSPRKSGKEAAKGAAVAPQTPPSAVSSEANHPARQRIIDGARQHFLAHGFRSVTMDDLAQELAMSKKTLYAHFSSKLELVEAVMRDKLKCAMADLEKVTGDTTRDFPSALHDLLACMQEHTREILPPFIRDVKREAPHLFAIVEQGRREMISRHFGRLFVQGKREGRVRKDVPLEVIVEILLAATTAIANPTKITELGLTPREAYMGIVTVVLEGALVPEGRTK